LALTDMDPSSEYGILQNNYTGCINLSDPTTWQGHIVNHSGILYVNKNTTLCRDTYYMDVSPMNQFLLFMNTSNIYLDCNLSIIDGVDQDSACIQAGCPPLSVCPLKYENNSIYNCTARNYGYGFQSTESGNIFINNIAFNNSNAGFILTGARNNVLYNNLALNSTGFFGNGFEFSGAHGTLAYNNTAEGSVMYGFYLSGNSDSNILHDSSAHLNGIGFGIYMSSQNVLENCTSENNTGTGFVLTTKGSLPDLYNNLTNTYAYNNSAYGYNIAAGSNIFTNATARQNSLQGFYVSNYYYNSFESSSALDNLDSGFQVDFTEYHNFTSCISSGNANEGFALYAARNIEIRNCTSSGNSNSGFLISDAVMSQSEGVIISGSAAYGNPAYGLSINNSNNTVAQDLHLYNNGYDLYIETDATPREAYLYNLTIDNPIGNFENYT
ncbi:MAG TPA: right-handed parallel beta-helix repeat-containing protein, partial [Candidatus Bilamarchaeaceae archaeon]|nr:right-handed parallel beta-helix repeat-containing protein [Candidatus Bilamarchaeaceae archaeon]